MLPPPGGMSAEMRLEAEQLLESCQRLPHYSARASMKVKEKERTLQEWGKVNGT